MLTVKSTVFALTETLSAWIFAFAPIFAVVVMFESLTTSAVLALGTKSLTEPSILVSITPLSLSAIRFKILNLNLSPILSFGSLGSTVA